MGLGKQYEARYFFYRAKILSQISSYSIDINYSKD